MLIFAWAYCWRDEEEDGKVAYEHEHHGDPMAEEESLSEKSDIQRVRRQADVSALHSSSWLLASTISPLIKNSLALRLCD